ncbi:tyrosine-protein phosphatase DSP5-like [Zingiber officinale]|uniref:tyrosine-protein phosphatase DSP5-like n=1 Tax=Zingiber officinale TaxID=94328 RepID=UPI001C4B1376|nr:tyrosine-protein phosphatase DSP5-like [Zingiber officinale]
MILELAAVLEEQRQSPQCLRTLARSAVEDVMLLPPPNFGVVDRGIYRSGFPAADSLPFLEALELRSIVCLCPDPYSEENAEFVRSHGIRLFQFGIEGSRESINDSSYTIMEALRVLLDARNHPILIHCKRGKHRTGCVVGCFRRLQNWCMTSVHEEYVKFASTKARPSDMVFIEKFDISQMMECVFGIIYRYHFSGHQARRLVYQKIS